MKIAVVIVRTLMGLMFAVGAAAYFLKLAPQPELSGTTKVFMEGLVATGYMMTLIKATELVCGIAFVSGRYVALASIVIAPIIVNIFFFGAFVERSVLPIALVLVLANSFLAYSNWDKYKPILAPK